jgi:heterodisulfide reductase subunit A2
MDGWYTERHPKLDPVATMTDGVFVAGVCQGPKDIPASVAQGRGGGPRVGHDHQGQGDDRAGGGEDRRRGLLGLQDLQQHVPVQRHRVRRGSEVSHIITALCKGCGTCVAACPAGVITGAHFNNKQIFRGNPRHSCGMPRNRRALRLSSPRPYPYRPRKEESHP